MARMRVLKPELPGHEKLAKVSRDARLLFVWIITDCDDVGRFMAAPKRLAGHLYPYDDDVTGSDVSMWLGELVRVGLVELYTIDGGQFGHLPGWTKHQNPSHPSPSRIPPPVTSGNEPLRNVSGDIPETFANRSRNPRASSSSSSSSSSPSTTSEFTTHENPPPKGGGGFLLETREAIARLAVLEAEASPSPIRNRTAWLGTVRERITDERGAELEAAVHRLRDAGKEPSPYAVIDEAHRHTKRLACEPGARSWGKSRAALTFEEVSGLAFEQWPEDLDLVNTALTAWTCAQRVEVEL